MHVRREFHDLHTGDSFSFEQDGPVYRVDDADYLDLSGRTNEGPSAPHRLVMYWAEDGFHGHLANHDPVWVQIPD